VDGILDTNILQVGPVRVASFETAGRESYGVVRDDGIAEAGSDWRRSYPDLLAVLAAGNLGALDAACGGRPLNPPALQFLPVIPRPDKILCIGVNYRPHVEEMGREVPGQPLVFVRFSGSVVGHGRPLVRPAVSGQYDYEGELAVVIGRRARHVARTDALDFVAGYTCFMDGSVRDWQRHTTQFTAGKNFPHSGAIGPYLVSRDAIPDGAGLELVTRVNGEAVQTGNTGELIFDVPRLIEYCSTFTELLPGDVIATGTPGGVGAARRPPVWLEAGDRVAVEIERIGRLENPVRDESR
jgi:2-keto-4-pentenoate hydratase/2-oxohepta-3-ene-1,7-dioic acid hydratase in catechol pathway